MNWFSWLFIAMGIVAALFIGWSLSTREGTLSGDLFPVRRNLFWLFILLIIAPTLGIVVGLLTRVDSGAP
jgi:hypothetical protein